MSAGSGIGLENSRVHRNSSSLGACDNGASAMTDGQQVMLGVWPAVICGMCLAGGGASDLFT